ncbi:hypothetical protein [Thalassoglobus polymorphus]|uniref:Phospholipase C/D domain-containing protein n=1 Tax=Thalassoglobus polymorphus TaxID=2527994 RepID=A0A517QQ64_9PLAN|nr:hypothetical protein [Thalassoglobus polymorphus]QDT33775.1 hypothetical protein Mal48_30300 [Thalassoglobus polymorphus]
MNYFTHAIRYLDRPYYAAGVCVPDWLSVVDRKARVRGKKIAQELPMLAGDEVEIALGIQKHLDDDRWFHGTEAFYRVTGIIARSFRENLDESNAWRCGFLGHIVMELLLDAALIEQRPSRLEAFYKLLNEIDLARLQGVVSSLATKEVTKLSWMVEMFIRERFLEDYLDDERLLFRLNQVMKRIQLEPLPDVCLKTLEVARDVVRAEVGSLLPEANFPERTVLPITG